MEQQSSLFSNVSFDEQAKQSLKSAAGAGFIWTLVSLISSVVGFISFFIKKNEYDQILSRYGDYGTTTSSRGSGIVSLLISLGIAVALFIIMNKFNTLTKSAIAANNQEQMNEGLRNLKTYFNVVGIILIIALVFITLGMLIVLLAAGSRM